MAPIVLEVCQDYVGRPSTARSRAPLVDTALAPTSPPPPRTASVASRSPPPAMSHVRLATSFERAALSTDIARILATQNGKAEIVVLLRVLEAGVGRESSTVFACSPAPKPKRICPAASEHSYQHLLRPSKLRAHREMSDRVYSTARSSGAYTPIVFKSRVVSSRWLGSAV